MGPDPRTGAPKKRKVNLSGCPVRALFWLPAPVSFSSGAALLARSFRVPFCVPGLLVVVLGSWSVCALSWLPVFCFVSFRCPEVVDMFEVQMGADPITELSIGISRNATVDIVWGYFISGAVRLF